MYLTLTRHIPHSHQTCTLTLTRHVHSPHIPSPSPHIPSPDMYTQTCTLTLTRHVPSPSPDMYPHPHQTCTLTFTRHVPSPSPDMYPHTHQTCTTHVAYKVQSCMPISITKLTPLVLTNQVLMPAVPCNGPSLPGRCSTTDTDRRQSSPEKRKTTPIKITTSIQSVKQTIEVHDVLFITLLSHSHLPNSNLISGPTFQFSLRASCTYNSTYANHR